MSADELEHEVSTLARRDASWRDVDWRPASDALADARALSNLLRIVPGKSRARDRPPVRETSRLRTAPSRGLSDTSD